MDTPISEAGFTGVAVGAAMTGLRPVVDIMFGDFLTLTMDQMVNQAAKVHYMSGGEWKVPMVMRTTLGATRRSAAQHSQSLHAWFSHVPGIEGGDAVDSLRRQGIAEDGHSRRQSGRLFRRQDDVPQAERSGAGGGVHDPVRSGGCEARGQRHHAGCDQQHGAGGARERRTCSRRPASAPKSLIREPLWPLDEKTLIESAKKTSRAIVIDEGYGRYGVTAEIAAVIAEGAFYNLDEAGKADGGDARPDSVFSSAGRCDRADTEKSVFDGAKHVQLNNG